MSAGSPSILVVFPSSFHYPEWMERVEIKTSQLLLASYLAEYFPVEYADFEITIGRPNTSIQIRRYERLVREFLSKREFDILAISCWTSLSYQATMTTARIFRELYPSKLIVVGGYHPTARPDDFKTPDNLFDYVVQGEGELALRKIAENFRASGRPKATTVVHAPLFPEADFVAYNWSLVENFAADNFPKGIGIAYLYLSRGCPFDCSFCMEPVKERKWRPYSPRDALAHLLNMADKWKARSVGIADACFGMRPQWRKEFLRLLAEDERPFWIALETRPEYLDEEDIKLLSHLKIEVQLGVESCSPEMILIMRKSKQPQKFLEKFKETSHLMSKYGVMHRANLIFNHPGETHKTLRETLSFIDAELENRDTTLFWASHGYMHFPGSDVDTSRTLYEQRYGARFLEAEWWKGSTDQYVASMQVVPSKDLENSYANLWQTEMSKREEKMKTALSDAAFTFAANTHFLHWKNDPRYRQTETSLDVS